MGGHAYGSVYPGPIGKLITPLLSDWREGADLPGASTLCGACLSACPVKIDIPSLLIRMRGDRRAPKSTLGLRLLMLAMRSPRLYGWGQRLLRLALRRRAPDGWVSAAPGPLRGWTAADRDLMVPPPSAFLNRWRRGSDE